MSDKCRQCTKSITARQLKIQCRECVGFFHCMCVQMSKEDVEYITSENEIWRCEPCKKLRRKSMMVESELGKESVNIEDVFNLLKAMREESKNMIMKLETDLGTSVEMCHEKVDELKKTIESQSSALSKYEQLFESMQQENITLKNKVKELENHIDDMEQYSRSNCMEINGIPEEKNENLIDIVQKVGTSLGIAVDVNTIDACHRLGNQKGETGRRARGIIVKFTRRTVKEELLHKRRVKRNYSTVDIGISGPAEVVYMNESLTARRRQVFNAARALKKNNHLQFVWVRNGTVLVRVEEGSKVITLRTLEQVDKLKNQFGA